MIMPLIAGMLLDQAAPATWNTTDYRCRALGCRLDVMRQKAAFNHGEINSRLLHARQLEPPPYKRLGLYII